MGVQKLQNPTNKQVKKYLSKVSSVANSITTQQILDMGVQKLRKLPEKQARKYLSQVFSAANKRVANLSKLKYTPTALKHVQSSGITKFGVKGKTTKELWKQYAVVQDLWAQKSGTVKGAIEIQENVFRIQAMKESMTPEQQKLFWDIYHKLENGEIPGSSVFIKQQYSSDNMQNFIYDEVIKGRLEDNILQSITYMIENWVEVDGTDDFWSFGQN